MHGEEQVVDLIEYVNILVKRWKLIVSCIGISIVIAAISIIATPPKYNFTMLMSTKDAPLSPVEVVESFDTGVYLNEVLKEFNLQYEQIGVEARVINTNVVKLSAKTAFDDVNTVKEIFTRLYEEINKLNEKKKELKKKELEKSLEMKKKQELAVKEKENKRIDIENKRIDLDIALINNSITYYEGIISSREKELAEVGQVRDNLLKEYEKAVKEKDEFVNSKEKILEEKKEAKTELTVFYLSTLIQDKRGKVYDLKAKLEDTEKYIKTIENEINDFRRNIERSKIEVKIYQLKKLPKDKIVVEDIEILDFEPIQLLQEPMATRLKVNKKPALMVSSVAGAMIGVILAFLIDSIKGKKTI